MTTKESRGLREFFAIEFNPVKPDKILFREVSLELDQAIQNMREALDKCFSNSVSPSGTAHDAMIEKVILEYDKAMGNIKK